MIVPYIHVAAPAETSANNFVTQSMPMAAMMMRNKLLSWFSVFSAVIATLSSSHGIKTAEDGQSPLLQLLLAAVGVAVCYMDLLFPNFLPTGKVAPDVASSISETVVATATAAAATATGK